MARKHYASAIVSNPSIAFDEWMETLRNQHEGAVPKDFLNRTAKTILRKCDPNKYLLSHSTIVASVDTYAPKGAKTGNLINRGVQINVRWPDFRIKPECHELINNNHDSWSRPLLLSTYRTFIGAPNYCFVPGTKVLMSDGTLSSIEDISVGDTVIGGSGLPKKVVHKHVRDYEGEVKHIYLGHRRQPITCTPNHQFYRLDRTECVKCGVKLSSDKRPASYSKRITRQFCPDCGRITRSKSDIIDVKIVRADELEKRAILYAPIPKLLGVKANDIDSTRFSKLMGFYLSEGCITRSDGRPSGVIFTVGSNEHDFIQKILDTIRSLYPKCNPLIKQSDASDLCINIVAYNSEMALSLLDACGEYSYGKKISTEWMNSASQDDIYNLIGSYASGDADIHKTTQRMRICSVSIDLLQQIQFLGSCVSLSGFIVEHGQKVGDVNNVKFKDGSIHQITCKHQAYVLHFDVESTKKLCEYTTSHKFQKRQVASGDIKFLDDKRITFVNKIETDNYSGKVYNLEVEDDHSYVVDGTVLAKNCEHIQLPELSKGFIVDAVARDLGKTCYVDILVATERKHKQLVSDIISGNMSAMSMGCVSLFTTCTCCGNVAADDTQLCPCIQYIGKGNKFIDDEGNQQPIAELIGHVSVPNSNQFIEASWVRQPAFSGAVRREILNPLNSQISTNIDISKSIYEIRQNIEEVDGIKKAASMRTAQEPELPQDMDSGQDAGQPGDQEESQDQTGSDDTPDEGAPSDNKPEGSDQLDDLMKKAQEMIMQSLVKGLSDKLEPKPEDVGSVVQHDLTSPNDNMVRASKWDASLNKLFPNNPVLRKWASNAWRIVYFNKGVNISSQLKPKDMIVLSWIEDRINGCELPEIVYKTAMKTGPIDNYPSKKSFLATCRLLIGRELTQSESSALVRKGRIASIANG